MEQKTLIEKMQKENADLKRKLEEQRLYFGSRLELISLVIQKTNESFIDEPSHDGLSDSSIIRLVEGDVQSLSIVLHHDQEEVDLEIRDERSNES